MAAASFNDTIAAIGTPPGESAIGVVRVSGPKCEAIAKAVFRRTGDKTGFHSHRLHYGYIHDPSTQEIVDEVLVTLMRAPHTYTREDVLEIQCHGGLHALKRILEVVWEAGARPAEPGEFTKRAFLNGRIDLTQAEAVIDVIRSRSEESLALSARLVKGELKDSILSIRERITDLLAHVEAAIDFPEEDAEIVGPQKALSTVREHLIPELKSLTDTFDIGRLYREGVSVAIVGKPNVGKSSLLNALLKEKRAIVTPHPGTTRDAIEAPMDLDGLPVSIMDTAGLRETQDEIEKISLEFTKERLESADLALWVLDLSDEPDAMDDAVYKLLNGKPVIAAANKHDLCRGKSLTPLQKRYPGIPLKAVSALYGEGLDHLKKAMRGVVIKKDPESISGPIITRVRHRMALVACVEHLERAAWNIENGMVLDRLAVDLQSSLEELGAIVGMVTTEDILDRIFSTFCIGK